MSAEKRPARNASSPILLGLSEQETYLEGFWVMQPTGDLSQQGKLACGCVSRPTSSIVRENNDADMSIILTHWSFKYLCASLIYTNIQCTCKQASAIL